MIKLPYPWEPFMCIKTIKPPAAVVSEVDRLKETIKKLEKENAGLRSSLIKVTSEKNTLKASLSQKRERFNKADTDIQIEQNKRRKVGEDILRPLQTRKRSYPKPNTEPARGRLTTKARSRLCKTNWRNVRKS